MTSPNASSTRGEIGLKIQVRELAKLSAAERSVLLRRAEQDIASLLPTAQKVIERVRQEGDAALVDFTRQFDAPNYTAANLRAAPEDFEAACQQVGEEVIAAIQDAHDNIRRFHEEQMPEPMWFMEVQPGIMAGEKITPVVSVGLYVPRGKGAFPSVMLMLGIPARVANVERVVVVTPPNEYGKA